MWLPSFLHFLCFPSEQAQPLAHRQAEFRLSYHSPSLSMEASWLPARDSTCEPSTLGKGPATGPFSGIARVGNSHLVPHPPAESLGFLSSANLLGMQWKMCVLSSSIRLTPFASIDVTKERSLKNNPKETIKGYYTRCI